MTSDAERLSNGSVRLYFRSDLPPQLVVGAWCEPIGLFCANEFGVFHRERYQSVTEWSIDAFVLSSRQDARIKLQVRQEPFSVAGRTTVSLCLSHENFEKFAQKEGDLIFEVRGGPEVMPIVAPKSTPLRAKEEEVTPEDDVWAFMPSFDQCAIKRTHTSIRECL